MNKYILSVGAWLFVLGGFAQCNVSAPKSFRITKETVKETTPKEIVPPNLEIVDGSIRFDDKDGNGAINANEACKIVFQVRNSGRGDAHGCVAKLSSTGSNSALNYRSNTGLSDIMSGRTVSVELPINSTMNTLDGQVSFSFQVDEPMGFGTDAVSVNVKTKSFESPLVKVVEYGVTSDNGSTTLKKKVPFDLQVLIQNTKHGAAEDLVVDISYPTGVFITGGEEQNSFKKLEGGNSKLLVYSLIVNNNYMDTDIPISINIREKYGKYSENKKINLKLNQTLSSKSIDVKSYEQDREEISIAYLTSAVDKNIPQVAVKNANTYVVVIANENYKRVASVPYARNDGDVFRKYCERTLGVPTSQVKCYMDATLGDMKEAINWLSELMNVNPNAKVILYYAGHGFPNESNKTAYLLPTDGSGSDYSSAYSLSQLYQTLGKNDNRVTIFLDACFSGSKRGEGMIASARGVAIKVKDSQPTGNMVVFSAAQGDETAYPHNGEKHGMFTYFLLKKLQETQGNVNYGILSQYIRQNVTQTSVTVNMKKQTPMVIPSSSVESEWRSWTLK